MITKKWVEEKLEGHRKIEDALDKKTRTNEDDIDVLQKEVGWDYPNFTSMLDPFPRLRRPNISVHDRLNAICAYLGIEIVKEAKEEKIVAKKIKKAK